ncbi:MAG: hypothetical protein AAGF12_31245 [Myxococcota bacterium]
MAIFAPSEEGPWLFGRGTDLAAFGGSALASFVLLGVGAAFGLLETETTPLWVFLGCILAVDVAHVWSTAFRVYLDGEEVHRRRLLYLGAPLLVYAGGVALHSWSGHAFWRVLAYAAVFHFVRQQYGWVALYRRRARESHRIDRVLDAVTIYTATLYPVLWWHGHLPRRFSWFVQDDFVALSAPLADALLPLYWLVLLLFVGRQFQLFATGAPVNHGKVLVVLTTWACWWVGIMAFDSDYAFTVTNVLIHGVPYLVLTYRYGRARGRAIPGRTLATLLRGGVPAFLGFVLLAAFVEELLWHRFVWHEYEGLFGEGWELSDAALRFLVPLLALPQATHYALDGFIWKRNTNPTLASALTADSHPQHPS